VDVVVATLARQDGRRVFPRNDHYRAREASLTVEDRYGLVRTSRAGRTSSRPLSRAETRKHEATVDAMRRAGRPWPPAPDRLMLRQIVRAAAGNSSSWEQFTERLHQQGVGVRPRMSERTPGQITGYAVALPDQYDTGRTIWFGGGKFAPDLTLPQLQRRWQGHGPRTEADAVAGAIQDKGRSSTGDGAGSRSGTDRFGLTPQERRLWQSAQDAAAAAATHITATIDSGTDLGPAGDAAWATADLLAVLARLTERRGGGRYTDAARTFEHAGRNLHHVPHLPTPAGRRLRTATAALSAVRVALPSESRELLLLAQRLVALADAVGRLRQTQGQAAQAAAARAAADQIRALQPRPAVPAHFPVPTHLRSVSVPYATTATPRRGR
jgi:hypothetical protein